MVKATKTFSLADIGNPPLLWLIPDALHREHSKTRLSNARANACGLARACYRGIFGVAI